MLAGGDLKFDITDNLCHILHPKCGSGGAINLPRTSRAYDTCYKKRKPLYTIFFTNL